MSAPGRVTSGGGLAGSATRGAIITVGSQGLRLGVQLVGITVLARLLSPSDYGLVAIVGVIVTIGELFRDFGLSSAAIQAPTLSDGQRDNLFWLNTGIGVSLAVLVCAGSPLVSLAFGDHRLTGICVALSATFVINGVSTQYRAMHARHLRFGKLSSSELGGQLVGVIVGVLAAVAGAGYWSLVVQQLSQQLSTQVLLVSTNGWLPGRIDRSATVRPFLGYGLSLLGAQLLNQVGTNAGALALGVRLGPTPVGLYNRAYQLVTMPLLQVQAPSTRVALPILSRLQSDRQRFADFLCTGQLLLLALIGTSFAALFAQAPSVIPIVLGPGWTATVTLFRILLVAGFFQAASYAVFWVMLAKGLTRTQFRYALTTRPVMLVLTVLGSFWGAEGAAVGYAVSVALSWPVALYWIGRVSDAPAARMFGNGARIGVVSGLAGVGSWTSTLLLPADAEVLRVVVGAIGVLVGVALVATAWPRVRRDARDISSLRRHLRRPAPARTTVVVPDGTTDEHPAARDGREFVPAATTETQR